MALPRQAVCRQECQVALQTMQDGQLPQAATRSTPRLVTREVRDAIVRACASIQ